MKKTLSIAALLCGLCVCANAASMVTEWTGGAGPTDGNTYELGNAGNWSNGIPSRGNGQGPDCLLYTSNHRPLYDWVIENCPVPARPRQTEFARLNLTYTLSLIHI